MSYRRGQTFMLSSEAGQDLGCRGGRDRKEKVFTVNVNTFFISNKIECKFSRMIHGP